MDLEAIRSATSSHVIASESQAQGMADCLETTYTILRNWRVRLEVQTRTRNEEAGKRRECPRAPELERKSPCGGEGEH